MYKRQVGDNELSGGISKFFDDELALEMIETLNLSENDILFIVADSHKVACTALGASTTIQANFDDFRF